MLPGFFYKAEPALKEEKLPLVHAPECQNVLLSHLHADAYAALSPFLEPITLTCKQVVAERGQPISHVYFPRSCILSIVNHMENGSAVEVGMIGKEGFSGVDILTGGSAALEHIVCKVAGESLRMAAADFRKEATDDTPLRRIAQRYLQAYLSMLSQSVACNRFHTLEQRFARWVLMTRDRIDTDNFPLTQEFLAQMLGVRRPSVSQIAAAFQQAGSIRYTRGDMMVLNRAQLEQAACECYGTLAQRFEHLLGQGMP